MPLLLSAPLCCVSTDIAAAVRSDPIRPRGPCPCENLNGRSSVRAPKLAPVLASIQPLFRTSWHLSSQMRVIVL